MSHRGSYAELYGSEWIGLLRQELAADCMEFHVTELDASAPQGSTPRALTQRASRLVFRRGLDGIHYHLKYGHDRWNWGVCSSLSSFFQRMLNRSISPIPNS